MVSTNVPENETTTPCTPPLCPSSSHPGDSPATLQQTPLQGESAKMGHPSLTATMHEVQTHRERLHSEGTFQPSGKEKLVY